MPLLQLEVSSFLVALVSEIEFILTKNLTISDLYCQAKRNTYSDEGFLIARDDYLTVTDNRLAATKVDSLGN